MRFCLDRTAQLATFTQARFRSGSLPAVWMSQRQGLHIARGGLQARSQTRSQRDFGFEGCVATPDLAWGGDAFPLNMDELTREANNFLPLDPKTEYTDLCFASKHNSRTGL